MKINKKAGLVAGGITGVMMLIAPAASAASTIVVDGSTAPGQVAVTGTNAGPIEFKTTGTIPASCSVSSAVGKINRGASATSGTVIGQIDNLAFGTAGTPCTTSALNMPIVVEKNASPAVWDIELTATPAKGAATVPIVIRDVSLNMHSTGSPTWTYDLNAEGDLAGTFNQNTQQITINTPLAFPLDITTFNGAGTQTPASNTWLGLILTTHFSSMVATFTLDTPGVGGIRW